MTVLNAPISTRFDRPAPAKAPGPFIALFQTIISFGLLPLVLWPMRWVTLVDVDRAGLLNLIARWRSRIDPNDGRQLDRLARRLRPRPMLMLLPWWIAVFNALMMGVACVSGGHARPDQGPHFRSQPLFHAGARTAPASAVDVGFDVRLCVPLVCGAIAREHRAGGDAVHEPAGGGEPPAVN